MIRATTPIHAFIFEEDPSQYAKILITYAQGNIQVLEKKKDDLVIEEITDDFSPQKGQYRAYCRLSQEDTRRFNASICKPIFVQVRVLTEYGESLASEKIKIPVYDVLNDEVLV